MSLNASQMLVGGTARMVAFDNPYRPGSGMVLVVPPVNNDGVYAPTGTPGTFIAFNDDAVNGGSDELWLYELAVNWTTPASSTFNRTQQIAVAPFNSSFSGGWDNITQPGTTMKLCALSTVIMNVPQYRNFGTYQTIVCCHNVNVDGSNQAGVRWYELRKTPPATTWTLRQQGTYAPDANSRWMGTIAMNGSGKIALGYSISSSTLYPGIRYTGQSSAAYSSASGILDIPEETVHTGANYQYTYNRWGDYASMSVDPSDDQTFWFTTEYIGASEARNTKVVSFKIGNNPLVTTLPATSVTGATATINGTVNPNTLATTYHFEWGTSTSYGNNTATISAGSGSTAIAVNANLTGLIAGTTYHFRLVAVNSDGPANGNDLIFIPGGAAVTTSAVTSITASSATSGGNVSSDGGSAVTARGVCWSTSANPSIAGSHTTDGSGLGVFTSPITALSANTTYHVRAYATNGNGTYYGDDIQFTTLCGISTLPLTENFTGASLPNCWSTQVSGTGGVDKWTVSVTTNAGGTANEMKSTWQSVNPGTTRLITPPINTSGMTQLNLSFKHYLDAFAAGVTLRVQSSTDKITWTDEAWSLVSTATNVGPATVNTTVTSNLNSAATYIAFVVIGDLYQYDYWYIDDVSVVSNGPTLSIAPSNQNVTPLAGNTSFAVTSNSAWTVASNQGWCTVTPSGSGNGTLTATYTLNNTASSRVANITVSVTGLTPQVVTVTQAAPTLSVTPSNQSVTPIAGNTSFAVTSNSSWTASSSQGWCTVTPSGTGDGTITAGYTLNNTGSPRVANITVTVTGLTPVVVTVTQAAPTLSVTPADQPVSFPSGNTSFSVTSNSSWTASSSQGWCTVTSSGTGSGTITATYTLNSLLTSRVANITVTVAGLTPVVVTVTQAGTPPTLSVSPADRPVTPAAGNTSFTVTSNTAWSVSSNQSWCTVTPSGSGNGTITANYSVNNTSLARVATITVTVSGLSPVTVTVTQAAPTLSVSPANQPVAYSAGNTSFTVTSNTNWSASSDQLWCTVTSSGSGNGTITANYTANPTYVVRVANVTVNVPGLSSVIVTVTQAAAPPAELNYTIVNDVQTSDRTLEFDLFLLDTQPATPLELSMIQTGILVSNTIINGGTISTSIVPGSSQLVSAEQPNAISWVTGSPNGCIKIAARAIPGCGNGTIISTSGSGTKICRVKITNSVPFTSGSQANLAFNFAGVPFLTTKVYQYLSCTSTQMTTNTSNCFSLAANPILNGPPSLSVSPSDRPVTASAGNTSFAVTSNAAWTASSDQLWCLVTPSGFGSATILANYTENTSASPRVATITVSVAGLSPILVTVSQAGVPFKTLNLSSLFLEGLYNGYGTMFQAQDAVYDEFGNITGVIPKWTDGSADHIAVELHSSAWRFDPACSCDTSDYPTIVYAASGVPLTTTGTVTLSVPAENNGAYYLTIRHRNSIETTSALPVDFSGATINYAFTPASQAFDANMTTMIEVDETVSPPLIFAGDVNQDGQVEAEDLNLVGNDASIFAYGYLSTDVFGDGMIEAQDLNISGNNAATFVYKHVPRY